MGDSTLRKMENEVIIRRLFGDEGHDLHKEAADGNNLYMRKKAREDGIVRAVLNPQTIEHSELDPQFGYEEPTKVYPIEPDLPAPLVIPFASDTRSQEIEGDRGLVVFHRIRTRHHTKDKDLLLSYEGDIRQQITDLDVKEILEHEDLTTFAAIDDLLGGSADTSLSAAGDVALWQTISGGLTPKTWKKAMQIMPASSSNFTTHTVVINNYLAQELYSWNADDMGPATRDEVVEKGWTRKSFMGVNLIITIKDNIVGNTEMYMFAHPNDVGRFYILRDITMYPDAKGDMLEWYSSETIGCSLQAIGCAKVTLS
jgi:hypothetical protein